MSDCQVTNMYVNKVKPVNFSSVFNNVHYYERFVPDTKAKNVSGRYKVSPRFRFYHEY